MKLKDIISTLESSVPDLLISQSAIQYNGIQYIEVGNLVPIRKAIRNIEKTDIASEIINRLKETEIFDISGDGLRMKTADVNELISDLNNLSMIAQEISKSLTKVIGEPAENSIFIKLPEVRDFNDLSKAADSFQKILSQTIVNEEINGEINIKSVENGSIWLEVALGTTLAVAAIGSLAWAAAVVYKKFQEGRMLSQTVNAKKIQNKTKQDLGDALKVMLDYVVEAEAQHFCEEHYGQADPEKIERVKFTIKELMAEMDKGAEVHPALSAPENVKNLFPDMKNIIGLASRIKQIEN
ncbi:hypothetical protein [Pedobacter miscanthi]|uniref:hypothetical protein n=1 Tax=Pedobacter miscanthi TaxID=2259170 RepID=UPI002931C4CA|nr:hypothetical protein [Pedobacter miscanthi]